MCSVFLYFVQTGVIFSYFAISVLFYNLSKCIPLFFLIYFISAAVILRASHALVAQCCIIVLMISLFALLTLNFCSSLCLPSFFSCGIDPACWTICTCVASEQIPIYDVTHATSILGKAAVSVPRIKSDRLRSC